MYTINFVNLFSAGTRLLKYLVVPAISKKVHSWLRAFAEEALHPRAVVASAPLERPDSAAEEAEAFPVRNQAMNRAVPEHHFARTKLKTFPSYLSRTIHLKEKKTPVHAR